MPNDGFGGWEDRCRASSPLGGKGDRYFDVPLAELDDKAFVDFRVGSRLMIVRHACPDAASCGDYYFVWESDKFRLLFKQPLKLKIWTNQRGGSEATKLAPWLPTVSGNTDAPWKSRRIEVELEGRQLADKVTPKKVRSCGRAKFPAGG